MSPKILLGLLAASAVAVGIGVWRAKPSAPEPGPPPPPPTAGSEAPPLPPEPAPPPLPAEEHLARAEALVKEGKGEAAAALYEKVLEADPSGPKGKRAARALADHHEAGKRPRKALGFLLRAELTPVERAEAEARIREIAASSLSAAPSPDDLILTIARGDSLGGIAARYGTTVDCLTRLNWIRDPNRISEGQRVKVLQGAFRILVEKAAFRLVLLLDGVPVRTYLVGTGAGGKTPRGAFAIEDKLKEPSWTPPGQPPLPYGHPDNILGTRWMGFVRTPEYSGLGIHGTTKDETIGTAASNGCVRMHNADVEELFDLVPRGTVVEIRD